MQFRLAMFLTILAGLLAPAAGADAAACFGSPDPCPYTGLQVLSERPVESPYSPTGVAVHPGTHDIYVADRYANAVKRYAADGSLLSSWGGGNYAIGDLDQPVSVSVDGAGNVWVSALNTNRITKFSAGGDVLAAIGTGQGGDPGEFLFAKDVAVAPNGDVWVADTGNNRVQRFGADGAFIAQYVASGAAGPFGGLPAGTAAGEFNGPNGIAVAPNGDVWVADTMNNRLQRLASGTTTWEIVGAGDFTMPNDVTVDADGTLFTGESSRTKRRSAGGVWSVLSDTAGGVQVDVDAGKVFLAQELARRVRVIDASTGAPIALAHPIEPKEGEVWEPQGAALDQKGNLFVADTERDRVVKLNATTGAFIAAFGSSGSGDGQFSLPWGLTVDAEGDVLVADTNNDRIQEIDGDTGAFIGKWGLGRGNPVGYFLSPMGVAVAGDGSLIVADAGNDRIQRSNIARTSWTVIGEPGTGVGQFDSPQDVVMATSGDIYVADTGNDRWQKFPYPSGPWQAFGGSGTGDGQFNFPRGIEVSADGLDVFVADTNGGRVQRFSSAGAFLGKWGNSAYGSADPCPGQFSSPWGLAAAEDGSLLVTDSITQRITRFTFGSGTIPACDRTPPGVSGQSPVNGATNVSATPGFTATGGVGAGDDAELHVRVMRTTGALTEVVRTLTSTQRSGSTWTFTWSGDPLPDGTYTWEAFQHDASGNRGISGSRSFTVGAPPEVQLTLAKLNHDTPATTPTANPVISDDTPTFSGTAENLAGDTATVTIQIDEWTGSQWVSYRTFTTTRAANGTWSATPSPALPPDTYKVRASQATNTGTKNTADFWFQVQTLSVAQLNTGKPVSGDPPGINPVIFDTTPTFAGYSFAGANDSTTVTVHLDRWNGTSWVPDVHVFNTTRNGNGGWSVTSPQIIPETWRVRVTQVTAGGTRESAGWHFQVKDDLPLAVTHLDESTPVSGASPGSNPVLYDARPTFKGTASKAEGAPATVAIHLDKWNGSVWLPDGQPSFTATVDADGTWTATVPSALAVETWQVRVTQGAASAPVFWFQHKFDPPLEVTELNSGLSVAGAAPGSNPPIFDRTPTFKGRAGIAPGKPSTLTIHLDKWNGSVFVPDALVFQTTRDDNGNWSFTTPELAVETWQVRVQQGTSFSPGYWFHTKVSPPLAILQLSDGFPVSGQPPGSNPQIDDFTPTFKGTSSIEPSDPAELVVRLHRWNGSTFIRDVVSWRITRDANGYWETTAPALGYETYALEVTQGSRSSGEFYFHMPAAPPPNQPPQITIDAPRPFSEGHYKHGYSYRASFSCKDDDAARPTCDGPTTIDTSYVGTHTFTVRSRDSRGLTAEKSVTYTVEEKPAADGIEVQAVELSQGTQTPGVENPETTIKRPGIPFSVRSANYVGVRLVKDKPALARVFVNASRTVNVLLYGFRSGKSLGSPLTAQLPSSGSVDLGSMRAADKQRRANGGVAFLIPKKWMKSGLSVVATAVPTTTGAVSACGDCDAENGFGLTGIEVVDSTGFKFAMVHFKPTKGDQPSVVDDVFRTLEVLPVPEDSVFVPATYEATLPNTGTWSQKIDALWNWDWRQDENAYWDFVLGVASPKTRNSMMGSIWTPKVCGFGGFDCYKERPVAVVSAQGRPLTAVGHEIAHGLGRGHAGCGDTKDTAGDLEAWPPDNVGMLQGIGVDISAFARGEYRVYDGYNPSLVKDGKPAHDHMSYCASENDAWVSPRGWEIMLDKLRAKPAAALAKRALAARRLSQAAGDGPRLGLTTIVTAEGTSTTVGPGFAPVGAADSPVRALVRDAGGAQIASVPVATKVVQTPHQHKGEVPATIMSTTVPATGAESIALVGDGRVLAERKRSPAAPVVAVLSPKKGAKVGGKPNVEVTWKATDVDGDKLTARVEFSGDGGRTWDLVSMGQTGSSATLDREVLAAARKAMVRVTVNDGWNEASAMSGVFRSLGAPPAAHIVSPGPDARASSDSVVALSGTGNAGGRELKSSALTWYDGPRRLGRGASITTAGLKPGVRTLRLVATGRDGRTGSDTVKLRVKAVKPQFLSLVAPKKVSSGARSVKLRAAASMPSVLRVGRQRIKLGRTAKSIKVKVKRGKGDLVLNLTLVGYGESSTSVLRIAR